MRGFDSKFQPAYTRELMRRGLLGLGMIVLLAAPTFSRAQSEGDAPPPAKAADEGDNAAAEGPDTQSGRARGDAVRNDDAALVPSIDPRELNDESKQKNTEEMLAEMREALQRTTGLLREARSAKDIVQMNCINEKLVQIKGLLRIGERSSVNMYQAMADGNQDVINHEYTKIVVAQQRVAGLRAETEQCVGELSVYTGDTQVTVEIDDDVTQTDPTRPEPTPVAPVVPPFASPR